MALVDAQHVLRYAKLNGEDRDEREEASLLQEAAEQYLLGAGCSDKQAKDERFILAVSALVLHWHDHRELVSDLTNPTSIPLGPQVLIDQLKVDALKVSESDTGGERA